MFEERTSNANERLNLKNQIEMDDTIQREQNKVKRFLDMQSVLAGSLAGPQQAVNNAENYPSTWTTNPDGGANGQVQ
ncbi:MAG: hypothetical protein J6S67_23090 [Methanobrevibacter sp.]|nr:hypothetical protein [Methanobrevibacter sp.]